jgi:hypothetical protein
MAVATAIQHSSIEGGGRSSGGKIPAEWLLLAVKRARCATPERVQDMLPEMQNTTTLACGTQGQPYAGDAAVSRPLGQATLQKRKTKGKKPGRKKPFRR